jgi:uncharacterized membrane protein YeaQ/YmgE (transglycosylase-associated protein family)
VEGLVWWLVVGLIAGWATGHIMKGSGYGVIVDILLGVVGAVIGGYVAGLLGLSPAGGLVYSIIIAIIGACLLVAIVRLISGRRATP